MDGSSNPSCSSSGGMYSFSSIAVGLIADNSGTGKPLFGLNHFWFLDDGKRLYCTYTELINLFDTLLDAKQDKKEVLLVLYDLSAAFDCVSHETLIEKMKLYGFDKRKRIRVFMI